MSTAPITGGEVRVMTYRRERKRIAGYGIEKPPM